MVDYCHRLRSVRVLSGSLFGNMLGFLSFHLGIPDLLQFLEARFNRVDQSEVSHDSAKITAADDRESRGAHSHPEDLLDLRPGDLDHRE